MGDLERPDNHMVRVEVESEGERLLELEDMQVLDFDVLCSTVALQTNGRWTKLEANANVEEGGEFSGDGVLRLWEGEVLDCFDDRRIAVESVCCPCYRFGKNMRRAGLGPCFLQGTVYLVLTIGALFSFILFVVIRRHYFLYPAVAFTISVGVYLGFFRTQIRKKFNISGTGGSLDDCVYHLICPYCTLCQESRTLEMNNVQDGTWHGRGDRICIGSNGEESNAIVELQPPPTISVNSSDPCRWEHPTNGSKHT